MSGYLAKPPFLAQPKNIFELMGIFLTKLEILEPSRDAQRACALAKGGTSLSLKFNFLENTII